MRQGASPPFVVEALLKFPGRIIHELQNNWRVAPPLWLLSLALLGTLVYGVVVGSFSGGTQLWIAPAKIAMGTILSILICLPSLYIFTCLSGIDAQLRTVTGVLFAAVSLGALLLIGFAPIAWIFSQSTDPLPLWLRCTLVCGRLGLCLVCVCLKQWAICLAVPLETI